MLDSKFVVVATDLNDEKASQMRDEDSAFDLTAFAEHLVSKSILYANVIANSPGPASYCCKLLILFQLVRQ